MPRFTNQAELRYGNSVTNSNIAVGEILDRNFMVFRVRFLYDVHRWLDKNNRTI